MRLGQIRKDGAVVAAIFSEEGVRPVPAHTMADLIRRSEAKGIPLPQLAEQLASRQHEEATPIIPIHPLEVWGCGCTYEASASFRDAEQGTRAGMYAHVYKEERPEIFFKGTARVCVGSGKAIGIRADSKFTAPEPEIALILGSKGVILGYTLANDVSAWDIERENALYLPQSKSYNCCCALGPVMVTADSIQDPYSLTLTCTIYRDGRPRFSESISTAQLHRKFEILTQFLLRSNTVPAGSVLLTGTGIIVTENDALEAADQVDIHVAEIGTLSNPVVVV